MIPVLNAFIAGCCAIPATNLFLGGDLHGAAFAGFLSALSAGCALFGR